MKRLLIDVSHILKACLHAASNNDSAEIAEFEGKQVKLPSPDEGFDIFLTYYQNTLEELKMTPVQTVLVKDGAEGKELRRKFYPGYSVRPKGHPDWMRRFYHAQEMVEETLLKYGAIAVHKDGFEADDVIAALAAKVDCVIWSGDKDLIAAGDVYYKGTDFSQEFMGIDRKYVPVWKALVGDTSDKLPGAKGFGDAAFRTMLETFGDECLPLLMDMMENETLHELEDDAAEFKPFQKVLDNLDTVYASYKCAKFYFPGWDLQWKMLYPEGNGELPKWEPKMELVTADKLTTEFLKKLGKLIGESPYVSLDIETYVTDQGREWSEKNKKSNDKVGPLDIFGSILAGFSFTVGDNCQHSYYFSVAHKDTNNISMVQAEMLLNMLPDSPKVPVIIHNTSFELPVLRKAFELKFDRGYLPPNTIDTRILAGFVNENESPALKHWSKLTMNYDQVKYEEVLGDRKGMDELTGEEVLSYGCDDTVTTGALYRFFDLFTRYEESLNSYLLCDQKAQFLYAEAFLNGVNIDIEKVKELQAENSRIYKEIDCNIKDFLENLEWSETVVTKPEVKRVTVESLKQLKEAALQKQEVEIIHKWPGVEFEEVKEMTPAEIKRVYGVLYGEPFKASVRKLDKIADIIVELGQPEFAEFVRREDLQGLNDFCRRNFRPNPELNLRSPKQLTELLYEALGFPIRIRNKLTEKQREAGQTQGNPASNESALSHAIMYDATEEQKVFLKNVMAAKSCLTEDSLFYTPYQNLPHYEDGLVHYNSGQALAKTGRANASNPNISQVSHRSPIRLAYKPISNDNLWVSFDKSSQELAHCAWHSQDEAMLACFKGDRLDIHSLTGTSVYNLFNPEIDYEEFIKAKDSKSHTLHEKVNKARKAAKAVNFLDIYSGTAPTLAENLLISVEDAQAMLDAKAERFPGVAEWKEKMEEIHRERGYAVTPLGRRKHLVLKGNLEDSHELRAAGNFPIQGGSAEEIKRIMSRVWETRILEKYPATFTFTIHDQIDFDCPAECVVKFIHDMHKLMTERYADFGIDVLSSIEIGVNFGSLEELGTVFDEDQVRGVVERLMNNELELA